MSASVTIVCDYCSEEEHGYSDVDDVPRYWMAEMEIGGTYYPHICESCSNDIITCQWCNDEQFWEDGDMQYCEALDEYFCTECDGMYERHVQEFDTLDWGTDETLLECICGFCLSEAPPDKNALKGPWLKTIPA